MTKEDVIIPYFCSNYAYTLFLMGLFCDDCKNNEILNNNYTSGASLGCISTIFLSCKENTIDELGNSLINIKELEKNISLIADKKDDGYYINNFRFKDEVTLITTLRNKLAHGSFLLDLDHNRVIINIDEEEVIINISKLSKFVIASFSSSVKNYNQNKFVRSFVSTDLSSGKDKNFYNEKEYENIIRSYNYNEFTLQRKDGKNIEGYIFNKFDEVISLYKESFDKKILLNFEKEIKDDYTFTWETKKASKMIDTSELAKFLANSVNENTSYIHAVKITGYEIERLCNKGLDKFNLVNSLVRNLIMLDTINKTKSTDINVLFKNIYDTYGEMVINYNDLASSLISSFESLFSYAQDDVYKDTFDYGVLNMDNFKVEKVSFNNILNEDLAKKNSLTKEINKINTSILNLNNNLKYAVANNNATSINKINGLITSLNQKLSVLTNDLNIVNNNILKNTLYVNNNEKSIRNAKIIEKIRNSISHGNYNIVANEKTLLSEIIFYDIYEGKENFKASITLYDFYLFLHSGAVKIDTFLKNKNTHLSR